VIQKPDTLKRDITFTVDGVEYLAEEGVIDDTFLGHDDHGLFSFTLYFTFPGTGQGFGQVALDAYNKDLKERIGTGWGLQAVSDIIRTVTGDYGSWEKLKGQRAYALRTEPWGFINGIASLAGDRVWIPEVSLRDWKTRVEGKTTGE
jgi:hypothetical protein